MPATTTPDIASFVCAFTDAVDFQDPVDLKPETALETLPEWDSLAALGVIVMFDTEYGKTIRGDDLKRCRTVGDVYALLS